MLFIWRGRDHGTVGGGRSRVVLAGGGAGGAIEDELQVADADDVAELERRRVDRLVVEEGAVAALVVAERELGPVEHDLGVEA